MSAPPATTLREALAAGGDRRALARAVVEAVAALHAGGAVHGALGPGAIRVAGAQAAIEGGAARGPRGDPDAIPYAAPEVLRGARPGRRADVFAAASLVRAVLAGELAAPDASAEGIRRALHGVRPVPAGLEPRLARALGRALERRWWRRARDVSALLAALGQTVAASASTSTSTPTPPSPPAPRPFRLPRSRAARAALAAGALLALAAALARPDLDRAVRDRLAENDVAGARALLDDAERDGLAGPRLHKLRGDVACARGATGECVRRYRLALAADPGLRDDPGVRRNARRLLERAQGCDGRRAAADLAGELRDPALVPALRSARRSGGLLGFLCGNDAIDRAIAVTSRR